MPRFHAPSSFVLVVARAFRRVEQHALVGVAMCLCGMLGAVGATAQTPDDHIELTLRPVPSPFTSVIYELKWVGDLPAVALTRVHAGGFGTDSELELQNEAERSAQWAALAPCRTVLEMPSSEPAMMTLEVVEGGQVRTVSLASLETPEAQACVAAIRDTVLQHITPDRYTMPFWDEGEYGTLRATSSAPARLSIDGHPLGLITPVNSLRLEPGTRHVVWRSVLTGAEIARDVTVSEGMTTSVHAEF